MGALQAQEMISLTSLDAALRWHLSSNCYPPVPFYMFSVSKQAIRELNMGNPNTLLALPPGVRYKDGSDYVNASVLIRALHLESFITQEAE